jgi:hypothetical protein
LGGTDYGVGRSAIFLNDTFGDQIDMIWSVEFSATDLSAVAIASHDIEPGPESSAASGNRELENPTERRRAADVQGTQSDVLTGCRVCSPPQLAAAKVSKSSFRPKQRKFRRHFKGVF